MGVEDLQDEALLNEIVEEFVRSQDVVKITVGNVLSYVAEKLGIEISDIKENSQVKNRLKEIASEIAEEVESSTKKPAPKKKAAAGQDDATATIGKMVRVLKFGPVFYRGLDKSNPKAYAEKLKAKFIKECQSRGVITEDRLPTMADCENWRKAKDMEDEVASLNTAPVQQAKRMRRSQTPEPVKKDEEEEKEDEPAAEAVATPQEEVAEDVAEEPLGSEESGSDEALDDPTADEPSEDDDDEE